MAQRKIINHPDNGAHIDCHCFAAFGFVPASCKAVRGVLKDKDQKEVGQTLVLCQPAPDGFWSIAFVGIPQDRQPFTVELWDAAAGQGPLATVGGITLAGHFSTSISFPPNSSTVTPSFTAYGATNQSSVTARMALGTTNFDSTATLSGGGWFAKFQNVNPASTNWASEAFDTNNPVSGGQPADTHSPITVQAG